MANLENDAGRAIQAIRDRLTRAQTVRETFGHPQSAEERLLGTMIGADTPIARSSESIISPEPADKIERSADGVRTWMTAHAPTYDEQPSFRVEDESGWGYRGGGFEISADDITKPSSLANYYLLSISETSPYEPTADIWFSVTKDNGDRNYNLEVKFFATSNLRGQERGRERILREYRSDNKPFREMPEDDAIIVEDLLERVTTHLAQEA